VVVDGTLGSVGLLGEVVEGKRRKGRRGVNFGYGARMSGHTCRSLLEEIAVGL
jgi:hypothetical protein